MKNGHYIKSKKGIIVFFVGILLIATGCTSDKLIEESVVENTNETTIISSEVSTEAASIETTSAVFSGSEEAKAIEAELDSIIELILSQTNEVTIQTILDQYVADSERDIYYLYYGEADDDFWISPETVLPEDYAFSTRPVYQNAAMQDLYIPEAFPDAMIGRTLVTVAKAVRVDGDVIGVIGIDYYTD